VKSDVNNNRGNNYASAYFPHEGADRRVHGRAAIHAGKKSFATRCQRSKGVAAEHASSKEKAQNFSVTKVCSRPAVKSPSPTAKSNP
jgi:hypothetical protein